MEPAKSHPGFHSLCQAAAFKLLLGTLLVAVLLTRCSQSVLGNLPLALAAVLCIHWLLMRAEERCRVRAAGQRRWAGGCKAGGDEVVAGLPVSPQPSLRPSAAAQSWRDLVRAPVVAGAWETLCGSIVQEFIYDTWWAYITPDKEFPADVRRLLNGAFGQLARRGRRLDLRAALDDLSELLMEQIELYRDTRESILANTPQARSAERPGAFGADMSPAARDRALRREMKAERNLHPALWQRDGHYRFLRAVSEGMVGLLLDRAELARTSTRVVAREMLASCVLRPLMLFFSPYYAHRGLYALLRDTAPAKAAAAAAGAGDSEDEGRPEELSSQLAQERAALMQRHWRFEERLAKSAMEEQGALEEAHTLRARLRSKLAAHKRSRSLDALPDSIAAGEGAAKGASWAAGPPAGANPGTRLGAAAEPPGSTGSSSTNLEGQAESSRLRGRPPLPGAAAATPPAAAATFTAGQGGGSQAQLGRRRSMDMPPSDASETPGWGMPWPRNMLSRRSTVPPAGQVGAGEEVEEQQRLQHRHQESDWEAVAAPSATELAAGAAVTSERFPSGHLLAPALPDGDALRLESHPLASTGSADYSSPSRGRAALRSRSAERAAERRVGFLGLPTVNVVAADLNSSGSKDYVVYKIRVGDAAGSWTVSRRYRHFEVLHRQLRVYSAYRLKLPPKRLFPHTQSVEVVMERRSALDAYLKALLADVQLRNSSDVWEFLRAGSELYGDVEPFGNGFLRSAARAMSLGAKGGFNSLRTAAAQGLLGDESATAAAAAAGGGSSQRVHSASSSQRVDATPQQQRSSSAPHRLDQLPGSQQRDGIASSSSLAEGDAITDWQQWQGVPSDDSPPVSRAPSADILPGSRSNRSLAGRTASAAAGLIGRAGRKAKATATAAVSGSSPEASAQTSPRPHEEGPADGAGGAGLQAPSLSGSSSAAWPAAEAAAPSLLGTSPSKRILNAFRKPKQGGGGSPPRRQGSPSRKARHRRNPSGHTSDGSSLASRGSSRQQLGLQGGGPTEMDLARWQALAGGDSYEEQQRALQAAASSGGGNPGGMAAQQQQPSSHPLAPSLEPEDCAGISAPLYEIVDCIFELQTRGFFRRQVISMARQALSLLAGDTIDDYLAAKLRLLRQEHTVGRVISLIQNSLWPGGIWFSRTPAYLARQAAQQAATEAKQQQQQQAVPGVYARPGPGSSSQQEAQRWLGMKAEDFLEPGPPPLDEEEVREAVSELLLKRAPGALVRLLGKNAYASAMADLLEMLQSQTFLQQLGYGVLEIAVVLLFPELKGLFRELEQGSLYADGDNAASGAGNERPLTNARDTHAAAS